MDLEAVRSQVYTEAQDASLDKETSEVIPSVTGVDRGIRLISDKNAWMFLILLALVFLSGPGSWICNLLVESVGSFLSPFLSSITSTAPFADSGAAVGGQIAAVKTGGPRDRRVLLAPAALKIALGENVKGRAGGCATRMGTAAALRALFTRAVEYADALDRADSDPASPLPGFDPELEALTAVVRGSLPVHVHAHRGDDIRTALSLREEGLSLRDAVKRAAKELGLSRNELYRLAVED